jgi:hypothetical protein
MATSDVAELALRSAAGRAYERGRLGGAVARGAGAALLATPAFLTCGQTPIAAACLAGFALVVIAGHVRGESYEEGTRAGALAGILPCLLPASFAAFDPRLCMLMFSSHGHWICGAGGVAAGVVLGLRGRTARGPGFWGSAAAALLFLASIGCLPAGAIGFAALAVGIVAGGAPVLVARRALP